MQRWFAAPCVLLLGACPSDPAATEGDTSSTGSAEADTGGDTVVADTGADTLGGSGIADSTGAPPAGVLARGITIDLVEANQGVAVDIARNGTWLGPADRQAPLMQNRIALIRALWDIPDDWEPREIEAHLVLQYPDGTTETKIDRKIVDDVAFLGDLSRAFFWGVEAENMVPALEFRVELYEVDDALADTPEPNPPPTVPREDGFEFVGVESSYQVMKVVVVPFDYDDGDSCVTEPDISEDTMQRFQDLLYMQNPIDRLEYEVHEKLTFTGEANNFGELNQILVDLRFDEGALPETYYYGLIDVCSGGLNGAGGQANGIPSDPVNEDQAYRRVSSGLSLDVDFSSETIVHEIGHSQGRFHVACNGEEGGPDFSYPHEGGDVGEWGFGVIDFMLRHPTAYKDYMTYCHPTWVGNWGWNKVYPTIGGLSQWDADFPGNGAVDDDPYTGSLMVGTVLPDGRELWSTVPGGITADEYTPGTSIEFALADSTVTRMDAHIAAIADAPEGTYQVVAAIPPTLAANFGRVATITRIGSDGRHAIAPDAVRVHHHQRRVVRAPRSR